MPIAYTKATNFFNIFKLHNNTLHTDIQMCIRDSNMDDFIETFFLNLLYGGRIHTFSPVSFQDRSGITVIRPLLFTEEKDIIRFIKKENIVPMHKCCPMDGHSKRENMKILISTFKNDIPNIKANLFGAIKRSGIKGWNNLKNTP